MAHTEGPWLESPIDKRSIGPLHYTQMDPWVRSLEIPKQDVVCVIKDRGEETESNKRLIMAAPELMKMCEELIEDQPYSQYLWEESECECGRFQETGDCVHVRAVELLKQVKGTRALRGPG